jgi:RND family efflux transporter MFP subunit
MSRVAFLVAAGLCLTACHGKPTESAPSIRPALTTIVGSASPRAETFVGRIEGRYTTELAFRVGGRITRRSVSVGDRVKRGQEIAVLDTRSLELAVAVASADLAAATARAENATVTLRREDALIASRTIAQGSFDDARASHTVARASVEDARARLVRAREDLSYGVLRADFDGVITRVDVEVEQVVAPNAPVAEIVRPDAVDAVFDVPESAMTDVPIGASFAIRSAESEAIATSGKVREVGPAADRATRTRRVWVALDPVPDRLRLGTTIVATRSGAASSGIRIPLTAIADDRGSASVWVVEGEVAHRRRVELGARDAGHAVVVAGLAAGARVIVAGVHSLEEGQRVKPIEEPSP